MVRAGGRGLVTVYRRLSALVSAPTVDLGRLTATVSAELGVDAAVVTAELRVLAASGPERSREPGAPSREPGAPSREPGTDERIWARALPTAAATGRAVRLPGAGTTVHVVAPVVVADQAHSFLVTTEDTAGAARRGRPEALAGDDVLLLVTEHAATVASVLAARERVLAAAAGQVRADLVGGLLLGRARDADQAAQWAEHVGHDADAAHRVVLVAPVEQDAGHPAGMLGEAEEHLRRAAPGALTLVRDSEVAAVVALDADPDAAGADCARRLARGAPAWPVTVAVGGVATGPAALATSYDQARRTLLAARRLGRAGHLLRFDDLGIHRLLLQIPDPDAARAFAREVLGRLVTDDSERTAELLRTLARYFREDGSPQRVARALSVHPNTVGYRLRRAEELSGLSLERYRDRLAAQVALEILGEMAR